MSALLAGLDDKSVLFNDGGVIGGNDGFVYDPTNQRTGIRITPDYPLHISGADSGGDVGEGGGIIAAFDNPDNQITWMRFACSERFYFAWYDYADLVNHKWLMGRTSANNFILFDAAAATHRFRADTNSGTYVNSVGASAVIINGSADSGQGTGGFMVYGGGASPALIATIIPATGLAVRKGNILVQPTDDVDASVTIRGGTTTGHNALLNFMHGATDKWFFGKIATHDLGCYNYNLSKYAFTILADSNYLGLHDVTTPVSALDIGAGAFTVRQMAAPTTPANDMGKLYVEKVDTTLYLRIKWPDGSVDDLASGANV